MKLSAVLQIALQLRFHRSGADRSANMGGVMRCVLEIRGDGVAPVPVADTCLHLQQTTAESSLPPSHNPQFCVLAQVNKAAERLLDVGPSRREAAGSISLKSRGVWGWPQGSHARNARVLVS